MQDLEARHPPGAVCMITGDTFRYAASAQSLCRAMATIPAHGSALSWSMGCMVARNLNEAIRNALEYRTPAGDPLAWIWIMGDDHTYPADIVGRLLDREAPVVGPLVLDRGAPFTTTIHERDAQGRVTRAKPVYDMPTSGLYELKPGETCGDAGLLIRREVLEAVGSPWYSMGSGALGAEDQQFTGRLAQLGYPVQIDCELTMTHMTPMAIEPVVNAETGEWNIRLTTGQRHIADLRFPDAEPKPAPAPVLEAAE